MASNITMNRTVILSRHVKPYLIAALLFATTLPLLGQNSQIAKDGFPTGQSTPEGAASDMARALMTNNVVLLKASTLETFGTGRTQKIYESSMEKMVEGTEKEKAGESKNPKLPQKFDKVYQARDLRRKGPTSYAKTAFGYEDVKFVDMVTILRDGSKLTNRTLVVLKEDGKWYVHPFPTIDPLLSSGLNSETPSQIEFNSR